MRQDGTRGYANNEANFSVTSMNIEDGFCLTLQLDIASSRAPCPWQLRARRPGRQDRFLHRPRHSGQRYLRHPDPRHRPAEFQRQAVERRLEQLRVVPSGRAGRWRNLDSSAPGRARRNRWTACSPRAQTRKIRACSTGVPYAAATPTSTTTPAPSRGAAASPAMISTPGNVSPWEPRHREPRDLRPRHRAGGQ